MKKAREPPERGAAESQEKNRKIAVALAAQRLKNWCKCNNSIYKNYTIYCVCRQAKTPANKPVLDLFKLLTLGSQ